MSVWDVICTNAQCKAFLPQEVDSEEESLGFCPRCGSGTLTKCPKCEHPVDTNWPYANFCKKCGQQLRFDPDPTSGAVTVVIDE